MANIAFSSGVI